jgi:short-subunit dehydrogenase
MNRVAIITGSSSGIGLAIKEALLDNNYRVIEIKSRLQDIKALKKEINDIIKIEKDISLLINSAGVGVFKPHEELSIDKISELIDVNLKAPIIISNLLLRTLKKNRGHIINITSIEATRNSKFSALYSATKAGLRNFSMTLFEELRRSEVRVTSINPDITKTNFFDSLNFEPSEKDSTYLLPQTVANSIMQIINTDGVVTDITIRPQKFEIKRKRGDI